MKLPPFEYRSVETIDETVALLSEIGDEAKIIAGGQSLIPLLALRMASPSVLIDINKVTELAHISNGDGIEIGAMTRHRTAETSDVVLSAAPMLVAALRFVGHVAIRTRGTLGGSVAHADAAAELPTVLTALGGSVVATSSRGTRTIEADSFFEGFLSTSLGPDELVSAIRFPSPGAHSGWAFNEVSRRSGDFALVGAAVALELDEADRIIDVRIALSGVASTPTRPTTAEDLLRGSQAGAAVFDEAASATTNEIDAVGDLHGTAAYRRHVAGVLVKKGLNEAFTRAERGE
jgi:CO/xanthine dehydrogenase FAD-binding subunit